MSLNIRFLMEGAICTTAKVAGEPLLCVGGDFERTDLQLA